MILTLPVPSWTWAAWSGPLNTATYLADFDNGRARVQACMYELAKLGDSAQLHLLAYFWPTELVHIDPVPRFSRWKAKSWWTLSGFEVPLDEHIPRHAKHSSLLVHPTSSGEDDFEALGFFDRPAGDCVSHKMMCLILHTISVEHEQTLQRAYGYYFLIVDALKDGTYIRLGIGVGVSRVDRTSHGLFGRKPPSTPITLV